MLIDINPNELQQFYLDYRISCNNQTHFNRFLYNHKRRTIREIRRDLIIHANTNHLLFSLVYIYAIILFTVICLLYLM